MSISLVAMDLNIHVATRGFGLSKWELLLDDNRIRYSIKSL